MKWSILLSTKRGNIDKNLKSFSMIYDKELAKRILKKEYLINFDNKTSMDSQIFTNQEKLKMQLRHKKLGACKF